MEIFKKHFAFIILIIIIGIYLGAKAIPENSWDGWGVGSAQTMLSDKQWVKNGFLKNYFLFLPQGYSKTVQYFDDLQLRQHARGLATGGLIGRRLRYTHYPSGYLLPTALLMKFGIESRVWLRFLEILFSIGGLIFLYWFLNLVSNRPVAFLGILFYSVSIIFLDYADSLAAMPLEELLRAAIIVLSIVFLKNQKKYFNYIIWILYFALSLSSYDSTLFIFAWLIGLDLVIIKKIEWKKWIFWASAPVLAFGIQILQNYLYLGWHNMLLDIYGTFKVQMIGSRSGFFISHLKRLIEPLGWFFGIPWYLGIIISALGIWCLKIIKKYLNTEILDIRYLYLALAAVLFHFLFFPSLFFYQSRIVAIFAALLMGAITYSIIKIFQLKNLKNDLKILLLIITICVSGLWILQIKRTYAYIKQWPNNVWPEEKIGFDQKIKKFVSGDKVIFQMSGLDREISGSDRYPMAPSEDEYYTDAPILGFTNTSDLVRDFNYLKNRSQFPFSAIIVTDIKTTITEIQKKLEIKNPIQKIGNRFTLVE